MGHKKQQRYWQNLIAKKVSVYIEKKRLGLGKPNIIFVKSFLICENVEKFKNCENHNSRMMNITIQELLKSQSNKTDYNKTDLNNIYNNLSINHNDIDIDIDKYNINNHKDRLIDNIYIKQCYEKIIKQNINYDYYMQNKKLNFEAVDDIYKIMLDVCTCNSSKIKISSEEKPIDVVRSVFLKITDEHIDYILESLQKNPSKIKNIKSYLITTIYNAYLTKETYYQTTVNNMLNSEKI